jgi:hypothetical protein
MPIPEKFEPTRSYVYNFVRYVILPEVEEEVKGLGEHSFLLREIAWPHVEKYLTKAQLGIRVPKAKSDREQSMGTIIRYYIYFLAKNLGVFEATGEGYFRLKNEKDALEEDLEAAAIENDDEDVENLNGFVYAFSFPSIVKKEGVFPIKIGLTTDNVKARVEAQVKGSAAFENPQILGEWKVKRVGAAERAVHNVLKARGKWRMDAPGKEWFDTSLGEIQKIIEFLEG